MSFLPDALTVEIDQTAVQTTAELPANMTIELQIGTAGQKGDPGNPGVVVQSTPPTSTTVLWVDTS